MYGFLRQSTASTVSAGPFVAPGDGVTAKTALSAPSGAASDASTGVALVKNGTAASYTLSGWAHDRLGYYSVNLATGDTDTLGRLRLEFIDPANYAPVHMDFVVLSAAVYDWLFGATAPYTGTPPSTASIAAAILATPANLLVTDSSGRVTVGTSADKTGYSLASSQTFDITGNLSGSVGSVTGSVGSLGATAKTDVENSVWNAAISTHLTSGTAGELLSVAGSPSDPWSSSLTTYASGSAGALVRDNLDAKTSSRSSHAPADVWASATRSLTDKTGFALATSGLDAVTVEPGVNARQALSPILASAAGVLSGATSSSVVIKNPSGATTRIVATVDADGNRSSVALTLPA